MIKKHGGVFGRNPTFHDVTVEGDLNISGALTIDGETITALDYQGTWDASTNTPTLTSSTGNTGEVYIVGTAGTTELDGISNWGGGDMLIFSGTQWERVEGSADGNFVNVSSSGNGTFSGSLTVTGTANFNGTNNVNADMDFADNVKANFGGELEIYSNGSNSYIDEVGSGELLIRSAPSTKLTNIAGTSTRIYADDSSVQLKSSNITRLTTNGTGIDVTGTITADGLTVDGDAIRLNYTAPQIQFYETDLADTNCVIKHNARVTEFQTYTDAGAFVGRRFSVGHSTGNVLFYEDTGATPKFFWDASAESLGIGTSSPATGLDVQTTNYTYSGTTYDIYGIIGLTSGGVRLGGDSSNQDSVIGTTGLGDMQFVTFDGSAWGSRMTLTNDGYLGIGTKSPGYPLQIDSNGTNYGTLTLGDQDTSSNNTGIYLRTNSVAVLSTAPSGAFSFCTDGLNTGEKVRITNSGNVGIGTSSPASILDIGPNSNTAQTISMSGGRVELSYDPTLGLAGSCVLGNGNKQIDLDGAEHVFKTGASEWMRIDSSGNLLVGKTAASYTTVGFEVQSSGLTQITRDNNKPLVLNRLTSDGNFIEFYRDGAASGSIGVDYSNNLFLSNDADNSGLMLANNTIIPYYDGDFRDNAVDLGSSTQRWQDLYLSGGVVFGTTGGSVTSKNLDDYEEGTFTPTIFGQTTSGTYTYSSSVGKYTKVGNLVTVELYINAASLTGGSGEIRMSGLPFAVDNSSVLAVANEISRWTNINLPTGALNLAYVIISNGTYGNFRCSFDNAATQTLDTTAFSSNFTLTMTFSYMTF